MLLGVKLGILSEVMLFGALFAAYFVIRADSRTWPPAAGLERPELLLPGLNTALLVSSSVTMQMAVGRPCGGDGARIAALAGRDVAARRRSSSWSRATSSRPTASGCDAGVFGSTFYTLTGFHGAHVLAGLGLDGDRRQSGAHGLVSAEHHTAVEAASYYWHFVDVVWVFLFSTLYVL